MATLFINTLNTKEIIENIASVLDKELKIPVEIIDYDVRSVARLRRAFEAPDDVLFHYVKSMKMDGSLFTEFLKESQPINMKHDSIKIVVGYVSEKEWEWLKNLGVYLVSDTYGLDSDITITYSTGTSFAYQILGISQALVSREWVYRFPTVRSALREEFKKAVVL